MPTWVGVRVPSIREQVNFNGESSERSRKRLKYGDVAIWSVKCFVCYLGMDGKHINEIGR